MTRRSISDVQFLLVLLAMSLGFNVWLALSATHVDRAIIVNASRVGHAIHPFRVVDEKHNSIQLSFDDQEQKPTVLYIISPTCTWCKANETSIKTLATTAHSRYRFIGISLSEELESSRSNKFPFPIYSIASFDAIQGLRLGTTPQTIVISTRGRIVNDWSGAYINDVRLQVQDVFNVALPEPMKPEAGLAHE
jgi:hypothetical protein